MNIAYFITENTLESNIWALKEYYHKDNFFMTTNDIKNNSINEIALVNIYYVNFMYGKIIFDNITDFTTVYEGKNILPKPVLFLNNTNDIDKKHLNKFEQVLVLNNKKIERINHETL